MKTVIVDNSLCTNALLESAGSDDVYGYIEDLAAAGVRYVELDFRTVMKLRRLPSGVKYIFRLVDPMFMRLTEVFDFDYILLTFPDLKKKISTDIPIMLELPVMDTLPGRAIRALQTQVDGVISFVRLCGDFEMKPFPEVLAYVQRVKNDITVPVDFCPRNNMKTAVDSAVKFSFANADSVTLSTSSNGKFAPFEEFMFALLEVYDVIPLELNPGAMCRASLRSKLIFGNAVRDCVISQMELLDRDVRMLKNADTGEEVRTRVRLKNAQQMRREYVSAFEKMLRKEELPDDVSGELADTVKNSGASLFDDIILTQKHKGLLN